MTVTPSLLFASKYHMRYLFAFDGGAGASAAIPNAGGATPDLATDSEDVCEAFKAFLQTSVAADANARALLFQNAQVRITAIPVDYTGLSGAIANNVWRITATASGTNTVQLTAGVDATAAPHALLLDIEYIHTTVR